MTDDLRRQLDLSSYVGDPDLEAIAKQLPEIPAGLGDLRKVLTLLPDPTKPQIEPVRAADPAQKSATVLAETTYADQKALAAPGFGSIPAASVGVELPYVGQSNLLLDPLFERVTDYAEASLRSATNLVESPYNMAHYWSTVSRQTTTWGSQGEVAWSFAQENLTGAQLGDCYLWQDGARDEQTWFNSAPVYISVNSHATHTQGVRACLSSIAVAPEMFNGQYNWLVGTMRITQAWWSAYVATAKLILRIVDMYTPYAVLAEHEYDFKTFDFTKSYRLDVYYKVPLADQNRMFALQLVVENYHTGSGGFYGNMSFEVGDPQFHVALGPQPVDLAPKLGTYQAQVVTRVSGSQYSSLAYGSADEYDLQSGGYGWTYELETAGGQVFSIGGPTAGQPGWVTLTGVLRGSTYIRSGINQQNRGYGWQVAGKERSHIAIQSGVELYIGAQYPTVTGGYSWPESGSFRFLSGAFSGAHLFVAGYDATGVVGNAFQRALRSVYHESVDLRTGSNGAFRIDGGNVVNFMRTWRWLDDYGWWWPIWQGATTQDQAPGLGGQQIYASGGSGQTYSTSTPVTGDPNSKSLVANGSGGFATGSTFTLPSTNDFDGFIFSAFFYWDAYADDNDVLAQIKIPDATYPKTYTIRPNASSGLFELHNYNDFDPYNSRKRSFDRSLISAATWHHIFVVFSWAGTPEMWLDGDNLAYTDVTYGSPYVVTGPANLYLFRDWAGGALGAGKIAHVAVVPYPKNALLGARELYELPRLLGLSGTAQMQAKVHLNGRLVNIGEMDLAIGYDGSNRVNAVDASYRGSTYSQADVTYNGDGTIQKVETVVDGRTITVTPTYSGGYVTNIAKTVSP